MDATQTQQKNTSDPLTKSKQLLQDVQNSMQTFQAKMGPLEAKADASIQALQASSPVQDLKAIEEETVAKLDETLLGYIEDLDTNGEDFSALQ